MKYKGLAIFVGLAVFIVAISPLVPRASSEYDDPNSNSIGWLSQGQCMSGPEALSRAKSAADRTDWTRVEGAATFDSGLKNMLMQIKVFEEMRRLGTQPCPDLRPLFERFAGPPVAQATSQSQANAQLKPR